MNFQSLKTMIDNLVQTYTCPSCQSEVNDDNVEVVGTAWTNINVEVGCPNCWKHAIVRAQVFTLDLPTLNISQEQLEWLKWQVWTIDLRNKNAIKDEQIVEINKTIKKSNCSVEELFGSTNNK